MAGVIKKLHGPAALSSTYTTNIYVPASALVYSVIKQIHVVNKTAATASFRLYIGATGANAAGTEIAFDAAVPPNDVRQLNFYPGIKVTSADFLVGGASAATTLSITVLGEEYVV